MAYCYLLIKKVKKARNYTFVLRNEIVVALGDILIVTQADLNSGSLTSVEYALKMKKKIYTLPHRINESLGTQELVKKGLIQSIYDIDEFISQITNTHKIEKTTDELLLFCERNPSYEEAILKFGNRVLEYELDGKIVIRNAKVSIS